MRSPWISAAVIIIALSALGLQAGVVTRTGFLMGDFRAFYCAARVTSQGANPYLAEPLRTCETGIGARRFFEANPGVTIPAPLPAYAIAALVPLAMLPFTVAALLWCALLFAAWIVCVAALARVARVPWEVALAVFSLSLGALSLPFGEVVPLAVALICLAAYYAQQARWRAAALCTAGAMIEPHLGLPVALALAVWRPATRLPLAVAFVLLGALAVVAIGPAANLEYFTSVLPSHALSEATRDTQYSLTAILTALGVVPTIAVKAGAVWYAGMLVIGTIVAGRVAKRSANEAFLVCVPPAFAVFGGSFIHVTQIAAALPAALLLVASPKTEHRAAALVTLLVLVVPWGWVVSPALIVAPLFPVAYLAWRFWGDNLNAVLVAGIAAAVLLLGLQRLYTVHGPRLAVPTAAPAIDSRLAEASWSAYSRKGVTDSVAAWAVRIPTWAALFALLALYAPREAP